MGLHWCVSLLVRIVARLVLLRSNCVFSTEHMRLVVRPRLRAVPVLATAAVSPAMADVLATTAAFSRAVAIESGVYCHRHVTVPGAVGVACHSA